MSSGGFGAGFDMAAGDGGSVGVGVGFDFDSDELHAATTATTVRRRTWRA
jgi:hypothetical protein